MPRADLTRCARLLALLGLLLALGAACTEDPHAATQLVVEVDSDLPVPQTLARLQARVLDPELGDVASERPFQLTVDGAESGTFALPLSFGVGKGQKDRVRIEVLGYGTTGDAPLVEHKAYVTFADKKSLLLRVFLDAACLQASCGADQTCTRDDTSPSGVICSEISEATDLPVITPGEEVDLWVRMGGKDAGPDADLMAGDSHMPMSRVDGDMPDMPADKDGAMPESDGSMPDIDGAMSAPCSSGSCAEPDMQCDEASGECVCIHDCPTTGASSCAAGVLQTCEENSAGCRHWVHKTDCVSGTCADDNESCRTCSPGSCAEPDMQCDEARGECVCIHDCPTTGASSCAAGVLQTCEENAAGCRHWVYKTDCVSGACADDNASCRGCINRCNAAGSTACTGGRERRCVADQNGCLDWSSEVSCDDGIACTTDVCDPTGTQCEHRPDTSACTLASARCDGEILSLCQADAAGCHAYVEIDQCNDGNACTTDACNASSQQCTYVSSASACQTHAGNPCYADSCDPVLGCQSAFTTVSCNDSDPCTTNDRCSMGTCSGTVSTTDSDGDGTPDCRDACPNEPCLTPGAATCSNGTLTVCQRDSSGCLVRNANTCSSSYCFDGQRCAKVDTKLLSATYSHATVNAVQIADDDTVWVGGSYSTDDTQQSGFLSKWTAAGVLVGTRSIPPGIANARVAAIAVGSGRVAATGYSASAVFGSNFGAFAFMLRTSDAPTATPLWQTQESSDTFYAAAMRSDGALVVSAGYGGPLIAYNGANGTELWRKNVLTPPQDAYVIDMSASGTDVYGIGEENAPNSGTRGQDIFIFKVNSSGALQWKKALVQGANAYSVLADATGMFAGTYGDGTDPYQPELYRVDSNGTVVYQHAATTPGWAPESLARMPNGNLLVGATAVGEVIETSSAGGRKLLYSFGPFSNMWPGKWAVSRDGELLVGSGHTQLGGAGPPVVVFVRPEP